jgi:hypothetical protein
LSRYGLLISDGSTPAIRQSTSSSDR